MTKQTFKIFIAGTEYSSYINYPVSITKKNLDESLNLATISLKHMTSAAPFKPNRKVELRVYVDGSLNETLFFILLNDVVEKIGVTTYYNHKLSLIEYTYWLDQQILPDMTITRIKPYWAETETTSYTISGVGSDPYSIFGEPEIYSNNTIGRLEYPTGSGVYKYFKSFIGYLPTLLDVANKILFIAELSSTYTIAASTQAILATIESPEWTFTRMTPLEALRMIFSLVRIVPTMTSFTKLGHIGLLDTSETTKMAPYVASQEAYDPQTYKTSLYSNVENFIAGEGEAIIEPANGWMTPRSPDGFEISKDNLMLITSRPIYKIEKFEMRRWIRVQCQSGLFIVPESIIPQDWYLDDFFDDVIYEKGVHDTLENLSAYGKRGGSFYYTQGKQNIEGLTYRAPTKWSWAPARQAWRVICEEYEGVAASYKTTVSDWIKPEHVAEAEAAIELAYPGSSYYHYWLWFRNNNITTEVTDPFELQFRITYTPYISTNIFTFRERYDAADEVQSYQTYNQNANVIASAVLADLHDKVIKRGSGSGLDLTYLHKNYSDLPTIGKKFGDYIITSADYTINQYGIQSTYNVDKYYQKLQKYVAVLEKWRQFSIPNEGIVRRQITFNKFAKFAIANATNTSGLDVSLYNDTSSSEIKLFRLAVDTVSTTIHSLTNFAFNNSLIWETSMPSNSFAGSRSLNMDSGTSYDDDKRRDAPVPYTDTNGRFDTATINFASTFQIFDLNQSYNLPAHIYPLVTTFYSEIDKEIYKDAREQLAFSLQLHHIDTTGKIYINPGWSKRNGLIGGVGINTGVRIAYLDFKPFNTTDATGHIMNSATATHLYNGTYGNYIVPVRTNSSGSMAQSWAIIDSTTNEILYWCDETVASAATNTQYLINFSNTY